MFPLGRCHLAPWEMPWFNIADDRRIAESVQVKILIPSAAVGAIIGKGGETMRSLKNESGCRLQMSKNQEVYHGRFC